MDRPVVTVSPDGQSIAIAISLVEGKLYKIASVGLKGDLIFDDAIVRKKLKSKVDSTFRSTFFHEDVNMLTDMYQDKGYAFVDVAPMTEIDDKTTTINLTFDIAKGSEVYFNRINIMGNVKDEGERHKAGDPVRRGRPLLID